MSEKALIPAGGKSTVGVPLSAAAVRVESEVEANRESKCVPRCQSDDEDQRGWRGGMTDMNLYAPEWRAGRLSLPEIVVLLRV